MIWEPALFIHAILLEIKELNLGKIQSLFYLKDLTVQRQEHAYLADTVSKHIAGVPVSVVDDSALTIPGRILKIVIDLVSRFFAGNSYTLVVALLIELDQCSSGQGIVNQVRTVYRNL